MSAEAKDFFSRAAILAAFLLGWMLFGGTRDTPRYQLGSWRGMTVRVERETGATEVLLHTSEADRLPLVWQKVAPPDPDGAKEID